MIMHYKPMIWSREVLPVEDIKTIVRDSIKEEFPQFAFEFKVTSSVGLVPLDIGFNVVCTNPWEQEEKLEEFENYKEAVTMSDWTEEEHLVTWTDIGVRFASIKWNYQDRLYDHNEIIDIGASIGVDATFESRYMINNDREEVKYDPSLDLEVIDSECCWIGDTFIDFEPVVCYWLKLIPNN